MSQWGKPYNPSLIYRNTNWIYRAGKRVFLLREPGGAVWVMQDLNKNVDPSLEVDRLGRACRQAAWPAAGLEV